MSMRSLLIAVCLCAVLPPAAPWAEEEAGEAKVGPGKAVVAANERDGLRLSEQALRALGLVVQEVKTRDVHAAPAESLVHFRDELGVYRLRDGWFKLLRIKPFDRPGKEVRFRTSELKPGDRIVVRGAAFLRAAELDLASEEVAHGD